jgi:hypothetical protein
MNHQLPSSMKLSANATSEKHRQNLYLDIYRRPHASHSKAAGNMKTDGFALTPQSMPNWGLSIIRAVEPELSGSSRKE